MRTCAGGDQRWSLPRAQNPPRQGVPDRYRHFHSVEILRTPPRGAAGFPHVFNIVSFNQPCAAQIPGPTPAVANLAKCGYCVNLREMKSLPDQLS